MTLLLLFEFKELDSMFKIYTEMMNVNFFYYIFCMFFLFDVMYILLFSIPPLKSSTTFKYFLVVKFSVIYMESNLNNRTELDCAIVY